MSGFVYFVQGKTTGLVKIGWARSDPKGRVDSFRCGSPEALELLGALRGGRDLEAAFHKVYAAWRVRGEWFWPHPSLVEHVGRRDLGRYAPDDSPSPAHLRRRLLAGEAVQGWSPPVLHMASDDDFALMTLPC